MLLLSGGAENGETRRAYQRRESNILALDDPRARPNVEREASGVETVRVAVRPNMPLIYVRGMLE